MDKSTLVSGLVLNAMMPSYLDFHSHGERKESGRKRHGHSAKEFAKLKQKRRAARRSR